MFADIKNKLHQNVSKNEGECEQTAKML